MTLLTEQLDEADSLYVSVAVGAIGTRHLANVSIRCECK
jgi:hypothetical protein